MGCDGGTIPRRDELVRVKKKPEAKDKDSELIFQWRYCAITQQILQHPIVMCGFGKLYNKISLIESLLNHESMPQIARHIKGLKDIKDLNLTSNPAFKSDDNDTRTAPYICPVIGLEMSGKFRFVALWSCGCVFSERALKEIDTKNCHKCQKPFTDEDVIILNGNDEDLILMQQRMETRQQKLKKKREKKVVTVDVSKVPEESVASTSTKEPVASTSSKEPVAATSTSVKSSKTAPVVNAQKRPGSLKESSHDAKKMKSTYSVAKDPKVTNVYKSIFTSHESEKQQNRAHWVTYNPFYN